MDSQPQGTESFASPSHNNLQYFWQTKKRVLFIGLIIFVVIIVALLLLNWQKRYDSTTPQSKRPSTEQGPDIKPSIQLTSEVPEYKISIQNQGDLIYLLGQWGVYGSHEQNGKQISTSTVAIHFTDKPQKTIAYYDQQTKALITSYNVLTTGPISQVIIGIDAKAPTLYDYPNKTLLKALYALNHPMNTDQEKQAADQALTTVQKDLSQRKITFVTIKKKL